jgi:hypothetical protein
VKDRVIPSVECVALNDIWLVPKKSLNVSTIEELTQLCPEGWSGYGGFARRGFQLVSGSVAGLPSSPASTIAVCGRQKAQRSLSWKHAICASAAVR